MKWKLVPVEVTPEIREVIRNESCVYQSEDEFYHALLEAAPPAPSAPDGWMRAIDEALVVHHIDIADSSDGYEEAKKKLNELLAINSDIARDCSEPPADLVRDANRFRFANESEDDFAICYWDESMGSGGEWMCHGSKGDAVSLLDKAIERDKLKGQP